MAKVDSPDVAHYMNPSVYSGVKDEKKKSARRGEKVNFSDVMSSFRSKTADELGPLPNLPAGEESLNLLMDEVRSSGDALKSRPLTEEIMRYKLAVRSFINYVVQNNFFLDREEGLPRFLKPGFKGKRGTKEAMKGNEYTKIQVIDRKLEDLAAVLLTSQMRQIELVSRLEEIRGLLVDLLQ